VTVDEKGGEGGPKKARKRGRWGPYLPEDGSRRPLQKTRRGASQEQLGGGGGGGVVGASIRQPLAKGGNVLKVKKKRSSLKISAGGKRMDRRKEKEDKVAYMV